MTYDHQKKQRNALLKQKAAQFVNNEINQAHTTGQRVYQFEDEKPNAAKTFVTGGGLPGQKTEKGPPVKEKRYFRHEEDEMLDECEDIEKDMQDALNYLEEVNDLMHANDITNIRKMIKYSEKSMNEHFKACDNIKEHVAAMNSEAFGAINTISEVDDDAASWVRESQMKSKQSSSLDLAPINEAEED